MKRNLFWTAPWCLLGFLAVLSSCNRMPAHLAVIPQEAGLVVALDLKNLGLKGQFDQLEQFDLFRTVQGDFQQENPVLAEKLSELKDDPFALGIDPLEAIYVFAANAPTSERFIGLTLKITNNQEFTKVMEGIINASEEQPEINSKGAYREVVWLEGNMVMGWDNQKFLLLVPGDGISASGLVDYLADVMEKGSERSLTTDEGFRSFVGDREDISLWMDMRVLEDSPDYKATAGNLGLKTMAGTIITTHLEFGSGEVEATGSIVYNKSVNAIMAQHQLVEGGVDETLLEALPGDQLVGVASISYIPQDVVALLEEAFKANPVWGMFNQTLVNNLNIDLLEMMGTMGGDAVMVFGSWPDADPGALLEGQSSTLPNLTIGMTLESDTFYNQVVSFVPPDIGIPQGDHLMIKVGNYAGYTGKKENNWIITTDKAVMSNDEPTKSLADTEIGEAMQEYATYVYWDMNPDLYPKGLLESAEGSDEAVKVDELLENWRLFDYLEVMGTDAGEFKATLQLTDDSENSLYLILKQFDKQAAEAI